MTIIKFFFSILIPLSLGATFIFGVTHPQSVYRNQIAPSETTITQETIQHSNDASNSGETSKSNEPTDPDKETKSERATASATPSRSQTASTSTQSTSSSSSKSTSASKSTSSSASKSTSSSSTSSNVSSSVAGTKATAIVNTAKQYIGVKYVWGGTTPAGFDCSGYTRYVFAKHGIELPRISRDQYNVGKTVSFGNLQPGDLVFFSLDGDSVIDHVGLSIGGGQFIHASSSKGVTISSFSTYWKPKVVGAKRVL